MNQKFNSFYKICIFFRFYNYFYRCNLLNSSIAPYKAPDFEKEILHLESKHEIKYIGYSLKGNFAISKFSLVVLSKICAAFLDSSNLNIIDRTKLKEEYKKYLTTYFQINDEKNNAQKLEPKSKYFKEESGKIIGILNMFLRKSLKIIKEIGLNGLFEYCLFCAKHIENTEMYGKVNKDRLVEILKNASFKLIKPFIENSKTDLEKYSSKFCVLLQYMDEYLKSAEKNLPSCIIFINERLIAHLLYKAIIEIKTKINWTEKNIGIGLVMGHSINFNTKFSEFKDPLIRQISTITMDPIDQISNIEAFRAKNIQILIATDVVEEGLDIPTCNLVCCFDPIKNVKSFVQMQGRARDISSIFALVTQNEKINSMKKRISEFNDLIITSKKLALYTENGIKPEENCYKNYIIPPEKYMEIPQTGAKICLHNARTFLAKYCQSLPTDEFCKPFVEYSYEEIKQPNKTLYIAVATLPPMVPKEIRCCKNSKPCETKDEAADCVAYEIITRLRTMGKLNKYLLSTSKYGNENILLGDISENANFGIDPIKMKKYIEIPLLNEFSKIPNISKIALFLYEINMNPKFPYLNQENSLGILHYKNDLEFGNIDIILENTKICEILESINNFRNLHKLDLYKNIVNSYEKYYSDRIRNIQITVTLSKPHEIILEYENYLKLQFFHFFLIFSLYNADFAFFRRVCSGKDKFSEILFDEELKEFKQNLPNLDDQNYVLGNTEKLIEILLHTCFIPIKTNDSSINFDLINSTIQYYKLLIKSRFIGKPKSIYSISEIQGKIVQTYYNKAKYIILQNSEKTLESFMKWDDVKRRKSWKLKFWSYYKIRYNLELNISGQLGIVKNLDTAISKRILHTDNCYQHFLYENYRSFEEKQEYLSKIASRFISLKNKHQIDLPIELCEIFPIPYEIYEIARSTPVILSSFNNISAFGYFQQEFFKNIFINSTCPNTLFQQISETEKIPISQNLKLHFMAEALTSGSANEGYSYQRLEFLGDSLLRLLEAWDAIAWTPDADIGELRANKTVKLSNSRLSKIGYAFGFDKILRTSKIKGSFMGYIPPGFIESHEYVEITNSKKNIARNSAAHNRSKNNKPFLSENSWFNLTKPKIRTDHKKSHDSDSETEIEKNSKRLKKMIFEEKTVSDESENENLSENLQEGEPFLDAKYDPEAELQELEENENPKKSSIISDKMVADSVESISAAIALSCGLHAAQEWLAYLKLLSPPKKCKFPDKISTLGKEPDFTKLEKKLGYTIKNKQVLIQAFTHASFFSPSSTDTFWEKEAKFWDGCSESYQRLQYLGEGTVDFLICKYLYTKYPHADPCLLHKLKICCLNNQLFCMIAIDLELDTFLRSSSSKLTKELEKYKNCLSALRNSIAGQGTLLDLDDLDHCFVKVLSDMLESLVAVVLYDTNNFDDVEKIFIPILSPYFDLYATPSTFKEHPKCFLYELVAKEKGELRKVRWKKRDKEDRKGFFLTNYKGYLGEKLIAEQDFRYDNCIAEKRFFKHMYFNVKSIIEEFHKRIFLNRVNNKKTGKMEGYGEYYLLLSTIIEDLNIEIKHDSPNTDFY